MISKHRESTYRGGRSDRWIKVKNRQHTGVCSSSPITLIILPVRSNAKPPVRAGQWRTQKIHERCSAAMEPTGTCVGVLLGMV